MGGAGCSELGDWRSPRVREGDRREDLTSGIINIGVNSLQLLARY